MELARISAPFAAADRLLRRSPDTFARHIDEFLVAVHEKTDHEKALRETAAHETVAHRTTLAGCMGLLPVPHCLVIYNLCVSPEFQGRGIGRALLRHAARRAADSGRARILAASKHGGAWFTRHGFQEIDPDSAPEEWRRLSPSGRKSSLYCLRLDDR
ncbi:GNAT family N-acetyltransferase [Streptomyces dangxiongensis]|uniref:GNAT family N-acetyltransferase n=1 Tax=Streptomyces dangxiongensis TaxID=1442032 RepID=A0A3G2JDU4_9ACTN|nr:GNAT family N-acetyltransferase [Streptomyces dangxiongensis]AYN37917.1 GNAT family N-acetyltransferase [Streptomyces dangxiongensis]